MKTTKKPFDFDGLPKQVVKKKVFAQSRGHCYYCGERVFFETFTIDHLVSKFYGGSDELSNLVCSCAGCNHLKAHLSIADFRVIFERKFKRCAFYGES